MAIGAVGEKLARGHSHFKRHLRSHRMGIGAATDAIRAKELTSHDGFPPVHSPGRCLTFVEAFLAPHGIMLLLHYPSRSKNVSKSYTHLRPEGLEICLNFQCRMSQPATPRAPDGSLPPHAL